MWGLGCGVWGLGFGVWGVGCGVWVLDLASSSSFLDCLLDLLHHLRCLIEVLGFGA